MSRLSESRISHLAHLVVNGIKRDGLAELPNELLLANIRIAARASMAGAMVVNVLPLLCLGRERASTPAARHEPGECVLALRVTRMVGGSKHVLHSSEEIPRDDRLV